jgi:Predicted transcriptional regulators
MNIGSQIKKLRRERNITQEQLAEYLNISVPAISQWESGKTAPDISQLPLLANIFKVSSDIILGIDVDMKENKIEEIYNSALNDSFAGYRERAVETLKKGLAEYPDSFKLKNTVVNGFHEAYGWDDELTLNEIIFLCRQVIDGRTDNEVKMDDIWLACCNYLKIDKREEAEKLAKSLPVYNCASNELLLSVYTGNKLIDQFKSNIMASNCVLIWNMLDIIDQKYDDGTPLYNDDEILLICKKAVTIMETVFEDGEFYYNSQFIKMAHNEMRKIYAKRKDVDNTLTQLENGAKYAVMFDTYDPKSNYSSLLFKGMECGAYWKESPDDAQSLWLLEDISKPSYDFIRDNPRFIAVEKLLKNTQR